MCSVANGDVHLAVTSNMDATLGTVLELRKDKCYATRTATIVFKKDHIANATSVVKIHTSSSFFKVHLNKSCESIFKGPTRRDTILSLLNQSVEIVNELTGNNCHFYNFLSIRLETKSVNFIADPKIDLVELAYQIIRPTTKC